MYRSIVVHELVDWIEEHLEEPLSLDRVAYKSGYSQWHLQRIFREVTGDSVANYIRKKRLQEAAFELKQSERTIADIAYQYQFDSHQSFTRAFKKLFDETPSVYRQYR
ncbi:helix-turn-helix domain-containing protein [Budviciaceae bacterium CWB-B4]|uniref:Helix-turn-helix domain-containing protein n=2 Tax=Limnobaculum TaxID=2172100 RepID=A0A9D7AJR2_9GAMM|nr:MULTISPECIES: helix-turn-helix domain-containing protein [Limnobaculum]MBK5074152.1 helix-turn-helix domain-containing protein [Limnobaculum xujianqingii]MBK5177461.1 helix-turn-helix domain-containing protein [Limnobaculum xujianqingii]QBH98408.1 helix-turn-helix domain-containing protein [Limnobaculum zhutongyuii]TQS89694.1 helix-turn-helix domain-containing protein [Limnobaculum zhutongyuii]